jgi:GGDEF domain-containing protein
MQQGPPRLRRARPVADAPIDALLLRAEDLTKGWLLALLEQAPLDDAPAILAADLAHDGPRVCSAVVRALADEDDLHRLGPGGAFESLVSRAGELAGSRGVEMTSRAVDTLRAVIWSAVRAELRQPDPEQVAELSERLNLVIELVRDAALRRCELAQTPRAEPSGVPGEPPSLREVSPLRQDMRPEATEDVRPETTEDVRPEATEDVRPEATEDVRPEATEDVRPEAPPVLRSGEGATQRPESRIAAAPEPAPVLDSLWKGALADEISEADRTGSVLSLLLIELEDADRVLAVEAPGEATATFGRFAQAVRSVVRRQDILACETGSRAWIIARETGRLGAHALAARMVAAVGATPEWRGAPLSVTIGFAVLGEDGGEVESLLEAAEEARFAAAASGIGVIPIDDAPFGDPGQHPPGAGPDLAG